MKESMRPENIECSKMNVRGLYLNEMCDSKCEYIRTRILESEKRMLKMLECINVKVSKDLFAKIGEYL